MLTSSSTDRKVRQRPNPTETETEVKRKRVKWSDDCFVEETRKKKQSHANTHALFTVGPIVNLILKFYTDETSTSLALWLTNPDLQFLVNHASVWKHRVLSLPCNRDTWPSFFDHAAVFFKRITIPSSTHFGTTDMKTYGPILGLMSSICFTQCVDVVDVSALGHVHTLNFFHCTGVGDVSALGNVHALNLRGCSGVVDVSALGNVHTLDLSWCAGVVDVSALGNVHTLCFDN